MLVCIVGVSVSVLTELCSQSLGIFRRDLPFFFQVHLIANQHDLSVAPRVGLDLSCPEKHQRNRFTWTLSISLL